MTKKSPRNVAASGHQRLKNVTRETDWPFNEVLQHIVMERFLYRLSASKYTDLFVLKGALLFSAWDTPDSRATRDIDTMRIDTLHVRSKKNGDHPIRRVAG